MSASRSPASRPSKYGMAASRSSRRSSCHRSSTGAENSSGTQGTRQPSHTGPVARPRRARRRPADQGTPGCDGVPHGEKVEADPTQEAAREQHRRADRPGDRRRDRQGRRHEARSGRHPSLRRPAREGVLRAARVAARRRLLLRQRLPGRPVHAARIAVLDPVRPRHDAGGARHGAEHVPRRRRHRSRVRGPRGDGARVTPVFPPAAPGAQSRAAPAGPLAGPAADRATYGSFAAFSDPDGNVWLLQEVTARLPGRVDAAATSFATTADLAAAMGRAKAAHGEHEKRTGVPDAEWPAWYAAYMVAEQAGTELPT